MFESLARHQCPGNDIFRNNLSVIWVPSVDKTRNYLYIIPEKRYLIIADLHGAADTGSADKYPNYYAALRAMERNDCDMAVDHLNSFLKNHSYVQEKYPDFYLEIKLVMGQCTGTIKVRGLAIGSGEIDPLPDHPPMGD